MNDKYKNAIIELRENSTCVSDYDIAVDDLEELVELRTPKKTIPIKNYEHEKHIDIGYCTCCDEVVQERFDKNFCGECGQALDWSDNFGTTNSL